MLADGERGIETPADLRDLRQRHTAFSRISTHGPLGYITAMDA